MGVVDIDFAIVNTLQCTYCQYEVGTLTLIVSLSTVKMFKIVFIDRFREFVYMFE